MSQQPAMSSRVSSRVSVGLAATSLFLLVLGSGFILCAQSDTWKASFAPVFGYEVQGVVYNRLTQKRLGNAILNCGKYEARSDPRGRFVIDFDSPEPRRCQVFAAGFEPQNVLIQAGEVTGIHLVPDPVWTISQIMDWQRQREFARQYDLLHSDVNRSWTREEFTRLLSLTEHYPIVDFKQAAPHFLRQWDYYGQVYSHVAVAPTWITFDRDGERVSYYWEAHLVKENGLWRWFREPFVQVSEASDAPEGLKQKSIASENERR